MTINRLQVRYRLLAIAFASALLFGCGSAADSTANKFMSLLVEGKHLEAQEMLSKDMHGMASLLGGISNRSLNSYYRSGQLKSFTLIPIEKTATAERFQVSAVTVDGVIHKDFLDVVQEDGKWKVGRF
jgi:hypothetical protein